MYRIAVWGTGLVGAAAVRTIVNHSEYKLVGCYSWGYEKIGLDVGDFTQLPKTGVIATSRIEEIIAARPDCVLYMPLILDIDDLAQLLRAGINVVSTCGFITGRKHGLEAADKVEAAALAGGVSIFGTGINPGLANALALIATGSSSRVGKLSVLESVDATRYASAQTWVSLGMGGPPDAAGLADAVRDRGTFVDALDMMVEGLGLKMERIDHRYETAVATKDLALGYMDIRKGTVCGLKMTFSAIVDGVPRVEVGSMWRLGDAMYPDWQPEGYVIEVSGEPNIRLVYKTEGDPSHGGLSTAMNALHSVPSVCAARPGIVRAYELPIVAARGCVDGPG
jgi:hypothetical protein